MSSTEATNKAPAVPEKSSVKSLKEEPVLQVERRDFVDLVPEKRPRVQSLRGFDDCYTDIVDYIVRCTHKIWDERDVGLIYSHYTITACCITRWGHSITVNRWYRIRCNA